MRVYEAPFAILIRYYTHAPRWKFSYDTGCGSCYIALGLPVPTWQNHKRFVVV